MSSQSQPPMGSTRRRVALLVESSGTSGRELLRGVAEYTRHVGHWSIYHVPGHDLSTLPDWLENWRGDGMIVRLMGQKKLVHQLATMQLAIVGVQGLLPECEFPVVRVDDRAIAEMAINHLMENKLHSLGFCGIRGPHWSRLRRDNFSEIARDAFGLESHAYELPMHGGKAWFSENERKRLADWIASLPKPAGIMACNDLAGKEVLETCRRIEVMVPEEVAVIGVDNDDTLCQLCEPMLSSVIARHDRVGYHAAELLDELMQGKPPPAELFAVKPSGIAARRSSEIQSIDDHDVAMAVRYIQEHACHDIRVADVVSHVGLSYSTLNRRFRQSLSRSIHAEIMRVRMQRIRDMLIETDMTLGQIARAAGYEHQEYLGAVFKSEVGMTLGQFRKEHRRSIRHDGSEPG